MASTGPCSSVYEHSNQSIHHPSAGSLGGQVWAVWAEVGAEIQLEREGNVAGEFDEVWSEALQVKSEGVGGGVNVQ